MAEGLVNILASKSHHPLCFSTLSAKARTFPPGHFRKGAVAVHLLLAPCFLHRLPIELEPQMQPLDSFSLWRLPQHSAGADPQSGHTHEGSQGNQDGSEGGGICYAGSLWWLH